MKDSGVPGGKKRPAKRKKGKARPPAKKPLEVEPEFRRVFTKLVRQSMYYAVRFVGYDAARTITLFVAITIWRRIRPGGLGGYDISRLTAPAVHAILREFIVHQFATARRRLPFEPGEAYRDGARAGGITPEEVRTDIVSSLSYVRSVLAGEYIGRDPTDEDVARMALDEDVGTITDYMTQALTPEDDVLVEARLKGDADFFEKIWPVVRIWDRRTSFGKGVDEAESPLAAWAAAEVEAAAKEIPGEGEAKWRKGYRVSDDEIAEMWKQFVLIAPVLVEGM
jgi:hypothetical protein